MFRVLVKCRAFHQSKAGGILVLALLLVFVSGLLTLSAALMVRGAIGKVGAHRAHLGARRAAGNALLQTVAELAAATNGWTAFNQDWARPYRPDRPGDNLDAGWVEGPGLSPSGTPDNAGLMDAESRINLNAAGLPLLERLLAVSGKLTPEASRQLAEAIVQWRGDSEATGPSDETLPERLYVEAGVVWTPPAAPLTCLEELRLLPGGQALDLQALSLRATVWGSGKINLNTASMEVLQLVFEDLAGQDLRSASVGLLERARAARRNQQYLKELTDVALRECYGAGGGLPADEAILLSRLRASDILSVNSSAFEGVALGRYAGREVRVDFVWDRELGGCVFWHERR